MPTVCPLSSMIPDEAMCINQEKPDVSSLSVPFLPSPSFFGYPQHLHFLNKEQIGPRGISPSCSSLSNSLRRQRGEKKPIPEDLKDDKYFERRKRNNQAAKKSRDARKMREDQVSKNYVTFYKCYLTEKYKHLENCSNISASHFTLYKNNIDSDFTIRSEYI
ncbi:hypothetical protein HHI36_012756 [Cryptolaemus montrouzieri]|uniref:BZIP domain-containing protein n=1 Tax=Cryptolaemus montrouzieri TaxID=559131 RepID=A0ABD2NGC4_9CUCU